ncbi:Esterase EstB [Symbiodinium microadriaticum]|uniref:Esterase EstB n=1 Tax=Symbiodinium microadriaticum TaxID=2951 RepID=A0A1Q9F6I1_SYMMI|nr:Esterase EstB [Symbiodinium microadriaticum]
MLALLEVSQEELHGLAMKAVILGSGTCALACLGERLLSRFCSQAERKRMSQERAAPQPTQAVASPEDYGVDSARLSEMISGFQEKYIDSGRMRGALVAVVRRGQIIGVWEMGGYNSETVFKLYSITKVFTALAGLQICEEENISMDTPVSSLVPEWPKELYVEDQGKLEKAKETLRLQHCFTHTGGFSNNYGPACHPPGSWRPAEARRLMGILAGLATGPSDLREMVAMEGRQPLIFEPGSHFDYGGVGLALIARIVEESSGMSIAVPTDAHPWLTPALGVMEPSTWAMVRLWIRGLWAKILGRPLIEAFRPAGAAVFGAKKLWDPSQKHFLPDAGLVCPGPCEKAATKKRKSRKQLRKEAQTCRLCEVAAGVDEGSEFVTSIAADHT